MTMKEVLALVTAFEIAVIDVAKCDIPKMGWDHYDVLCKVRNPLRRQLITVLCTPDVPMDVLRVVEWISYPGIAGTWCAWCKGLYPNHKPDCQRQAALAKAEEG